MNPDYINKLIARGENQHLDFKFEIANSRKIARTFVAFANAQGGKMLIGVDDKGVIKGIRSDEEKYMAKAAVHNFCKPEILFETRVWNVAGKKVLEITIASGNKKPYFALSEDRKWIAYIRVNDQNIVANRVIVNAWKRKSRPEGTYITFTENEKKLLEYLEKNESVTLSKYARIAGIPRHKAEQTLTNFLSIEIIDADISEDQVLYKLSGSFKNS
jgi:predicted HTH transcriptional regulator